jgi:hypothetical protein
MDDEMFVHHMMSAIDDAEVISLFFPLLRRALVIDARSSPNHPPFIGLMPQVGSVEERIVMIEEKRPELGKIHAVLAVPWLRSVRELGERGVLPVLVDRLAKSGMSPEVSRPRLQRALDRLWRIERLAFASLIQGEGYQTIWTSPR